MKATPPVEELRYDMSQFYPLKAVFEQLLGGRSYLRLKETGTLGDWKTEAQRLIKAIQLASESTVEIADDDWFADIRSILELGSKHIASSKTITALFAHLSATLARIVFLQIGFLPMRENLETVPLTKPYWTLRSVRTVQYVQNIAQRDTLRRLQDRRAKSRIEQK